MRRSDFGSNLLDFTYERKVLASMIAQRIQAYKSFTRLFYVGLLASAPAENCVAVKIFANSLFKAFSLLFEAECSNIVYSQEYYYSN